MNGRFASPEDACGNRLLIAIGLLACVAGCGRAVPTGMVRVRGDVSHESRRLPEGIINFEGLSGSGSATGRITADGSFEVILPPGDYRVAVASREGGITFDEKLKPIEAKSRIPERYESVETSGLQVTVTPQGDRLSITLEP